MDISTAEEFTIEFPNKSIAAIAWGPKNARPILALHGWLDNAASFLPLAPYLKDFRVIAIDLPGHGLSSHFPPDSYFHFTDYVPDVINVMNYLGWQQCALLGHSLGAGIASLIAAVMPERVNSLGLIDGLGPMSISEQQMPDLMRKAIDEYFRLPNKSPPLYKTKEEAIQARLTASKMKFSSVEILVNRGLKAVDGGFMWRTAPILLCKPLTMFTEGQVAPFLKKITSRTCLFRPSPGWPFDEKLFAARIGLMQNIEVHRINGDHHIHMDNPESIGPLLQEFYRRSIP
jgi:pimeloyl-ACP methyl ester carboxylesterase